MADGRVDREPDLVVGVDVGGTKTDAVVCRSDGRVVGFGSAGSGNWESVGLEGLLGSVEASLRVALTASGRIRRDVRAAGFGLAGLDWPSDVPTLDAALATLGLGGSRVVVNDAFIALRAGCRERHGIVSNAGTGTITAGRNAAGETFRTMAIGWGERGGASDLAEDAANAVAAAYHGSGPATALTERFLDAHGVTSVEELFEAASRRDAALDAGELAPLVLGVAATGDPVAVAIARRLGESLAASVVGVAGRLGMRGETFELVRTGGVHGAASSIIDRAFATAVLAGCPHAVLATLTAPPAVGAALLALETIGPVDAALHDRLADEATIARGAA